MSRRLPPPSDGQGNRTLLFLDCFGDGKSLCGSLDIGFVCFCCVVSCPPPLFEDAPVLQETMLNAAAISAATAIVVTIFKENSLKLIYKKSIQYRSARVNKPVRELLSNKFHALQVIILSRI